MCNCGGRRATLSSQATEGSRGQQAESRPTTGRVDTAAGEVPLISRTLDSFVLRGQASGRQYHFLPGATVRVAAGDARSLLASGRVRRG